MYDLYTQIIKKDDKHSDYEDLKILRRQLIRSDRSIEVLDYGAGSRVNKSNQRRISDIAKNAEKPERFGKLFHRLARHFQPATILELGTSLGVTTLYFAKAQPNAKIVTMEGCPNTVAIARENFSLAYATNIEIVTGNIDETLPNRLSQADMGSLDMVYFDANHRYEPTLRYFENCLPYIHENSLFIFDDIYWSEEMTRAWEKIKSHPSVHVTIDLFWIGLVFFRKGQRKEDFVLRF